MPDLGAGRWWTTGGPHCVSGRVARPVYLFESIHL